MALFIPKEIRAKSSASKSFKEGMSYASQLYKMGYIDTLDEFAAAVRDPEAASLKARETLYTDQIDVAQDNLDKLRSERKAPVVAPTPKSVKAKEKN